MYAHKKDMYKMYMKKTLKNRIREEQNKWKHVPYICICLLKLMEKAMAPHSSVLAWRIPGTGEPGGLPSMGSHRVGYD